MSETLLVRKSEETQVLLSHLYASRGNRSDDNWLSCAEAFRPFSFVPPPFDGFTTGIFIDGNWLPFAMREGPVALRPYLSISLL